MKTILPQEELERVFPGNSEMAQRMRGLDWSGTCLGLPSQWPDNLRNAVSLCLTSRFPILLWWGPELAVLYNDAYIPFLGERKHPRALARPGRDSWCEIWDVIGPMLEDVRATGKSTWSEDMALFFARNLPQEEVYVKFAYGPILAADGHTVEGVFNPCMETTEQVVGARWLETLRKLSIEAAGARTVEEACRNAAAVLAENSRDIPFAAIYVVDQIRAQATLAATAGLTESNSPLPLSFSLVNGESSPWPFASVLRTQQSKEVELGRLGLLLPGGAWPEPSGKAIMLPISCAAHDRLTGFLIVGVSPRRVLDAAYRTFFDLIAGHVSSAIADVQAYEAERRRAEALAEIDHAKTVFFSNVSHEFRTPLTLMLGPLEDVLGDPATSPTSRDLLAVVHRNGERLLKLVNTLLEFARIEAGRIQALYEPTYLAAFTAGLAGVFRSAIEKAGLRLVVDCPPLPEPVYVDREMWEKIVLNLISNAFKYTLEGEIRVELRATDGAAALVVQDTGTGIPEAELPNLFKRFHRIQSVHGRSHEGTGIGLAMVLELTRLHGGTVTVDSHAGKGSAFTVSIPLGRAHLPPEQISRNHTPASSVLNAQPFVEEAQNWLRGNDVKETDPVDVLMPSHGIARRAAGDIPRASVLVADDNADMRGYLRHLLANEYDVTTVADGQQALETARQTRPDLVLADVMMPNLDGFGFLKALRADAATAATSVILLSAKAGEEARIEGLQAGADDYMIKPFRARELLTRVSGMVTLARFRRDALHREEVLLQNQENLTVELQALSRLHDLSTRLLACSTLQSALEEILDAAIEMLEAAMGLIQLYDPRTRTLEIVAHRGLCQEFLDYFRSVSADEGSACARVMKSEGRIIIEDVQTDPEFEPHWPIAASAGFRAVQSTLLTSRSGQLLGVLSTQFHQPRRPSERHLRMLDLYARQGAELIERIRTEDALRENEARFRRALQIETVGVIFINTQGQITEANDAFLHMSGFSREDVAAGLLRWDRMTPPEWMPQSKHAIEEFKSIGRTTPYEKEYLRKDGSRWWALFAATRLSENEGVEYVIDLTERKRAEVALRESEERFRTLAEASPALIWQLDPDGNAVYLNPRYQDLVGKSPEQLTGIGWHSIIHPDDARDYIAAVEQAQRDRIRLQQRVRFRSGKGDWRWLESYALPWFKVEDKYGGHVGISIDITEAVQLELTQATYRMATEGGNEGFYIVRPIYDNTKDAFVDFEIIDSNQRGAEFLGHPREDLIGRNMSSLYQGTNLDRPMAILRQAMESGFYEDDVEVSRESALQVQWIHCKIVRSHDDLAVTLRDISDAKAHVDELERRGNEDALTGLPNRYWVQTYLPQAIERAAANNAMLAVLFMDLDGFKAVNDEMGHPAGDELLRNVARRLKLAVRPQDKVARLGGDEFVIIIENLTHRRDAAHVAKRVLHAFRERFTLLQGVCSIGISIGISFFPFDGMDADTLLRNADIAMYSVKTGEKRNYRFYDPKFYGALRARMEQESELRHAIEHDQFVMYYQPRVDIATGTTCSMEALVRWEHPSKGLLEPLSFIPLAEETGLILRLGELIIDKVCAQLERWAQNGRDMVPVSINVSPRQFNEADVAKILMASLVRHHIGSKLVEVEVTESSMMGDSTDVSRILTTMRRMGVKLLVDDFGTGYSSLSQLQRLDFDVLKVDRAFTEKIEKTEKGNVFFKAIITMAHALGMRVVAEGVENESQIKILKSLSCDEIQGFYISKPMPPTEAQPILTQFFSHSQYTALGFNGNHSSRV
jgi:diguanylate cyclase (GGDEF)-like protein/PAS domain S-box-containing protein